MQRVRKQILISAVSIFILVPIASVSDSESGAEEKLDLELRLKPGQKYDMRLTTELKREDESFMFVRGMRFEVEEVSANGIALIKVTYRTLIQDATRQVISDGGCRAVVVGPRLVCFQYDSTRQSVEDNYPEVPAIGAAGLGESFIIKVTPKGKVIGLFGLEEMQTRIAERVIAWDEKYFKKKGYEYDELRREVRRHNTKSHYSEYEIKNVLSDLIIAFPEQPLAIGGSWMDKVKIWGKNNEIDGTYTLKNNENGIVAINLSAKRTAEEEPFSWVNNEGRAVGFKIVGFCEGMFELEQQTGWLANSKVKTRFTGKVIDAEANDQMTKPILEEEVITVETVVLVD